MAVSLSVAVRLGALKQTLLAGIGERSAPRFAVMFSSFDLHSLVTADPTKEGACRLALLAAARPAMVAAEAYLVAAVGVFVSHC